MAITSSAKKAQRASENKTVFNIRRTRVMRDTTKEVRKLAAAGKGSEAAALLPKAYQAIDKAAKRGVIKGNTAARKKSRLTILVAKGGDKK